MALAEMAKDLLRKRILFFAFCEISTISTGPTHILPVLTYGTVSLHKLF